MNDEEYNLNYDFNYNMFLAKTMLANLSFKTDQKLALKWIKKLSGYKRNLLEMRQRNEVMYSLILQLQNGVLEYPFNSDPPVGPLLGKPRSEVMETLSEYSIPQDYPVCDIPEPSGMSFAIPMPYPQCGAYFYMAVYNDKP